MAPDSTPTQDATRIDPAAASEPKAAAPNTGAPSDAEGAEIVPEPAIPAKAAARAADPDHRQRPAARRVRRRRSGHAGTRGRRPGALKTYVLCFVERSGSTMLTDVMTKTGVLGRPEEFVNPRGPMYYLLRQFPATELPHYFTKLRRNRKTPNGVFGMKTIFHDFEPLLRANMVAPLFGAPKFIYLTRKDVVLQAISSYTARVRGLWHSSDKDKPANKDIDFESREVPFDADEILALVDRFMEDRLRWERFFALYGIEPLRIEYEALTPEAIPGVIESICNLLGVPPTFEHEKLQTKLEILRDERSLEFAERIRSQFRL
jgi:LPS sulfotransferase NodH